MPGRWAARTLPPSDLFSRDLIRRIAKQMFVGFFFVCLFFHLLLLALQKWKESPWLWPTVKGKYRILWVDMLIAQNVTFRM